MRYLPVNRVGGACEFSGVVYARARAPKFGITLPFWGVAAAMTRESRVEMTSERGNNNKIIIREASKAFVDNSYVYF